MKKQDLVKDLREAAGGRAFISPYDLRKWYGRRMSAVKELVDGLDYVTVGKGRRYFIGDVAERVIGRTTNDGIIGG